VRRLFYVAFGAVAGIVAVRRLSAAANKWTPEGLAAQAGGAGERIALWWAEVQALAAQREQELREALGLESEGDAA
jgi:limonene-1,2-epoxide hydrolase